MSDYLLAIDQGTTSTRAIVFDRSGTILGVGQEEFRQIYPNDGWVEHDPEEIWTKTLAVIQLAIKESGKPAAEIAAAGITNQRETTVVWDKSTGKPIYNAIVWQDGRTAELCKRMKADNAEPEVAARTGLLLDPYFSGTKLAWILDNVDGARKKAEAGELAFGTIDCFLLWRLTGGQVHATDATNASRTLLFDIHKQQWDKELCQLLRVPTEMLPEVCDSSHDYGSTAKGLLDAEIPIRALIGDQQSATVGQACFEPGMVKSTYGTGCFMMLNTGQKAVSSQNRLLTTVAYRLDGKTTYALEGSIFMAGATMQWLRDELKVISHASESEALAKSIPDTGGVYLVPAFAGLGAPYWDPNARGALIGLSRGSGIAQIVRAGLESVCYQTRDLLKAMKGDGANLTGLRVDGGMVANDWLMQFLANLVGVEVARPTVPETTALGAAYLAGLGVVYDSLDDIAALWQQDSAYAPQTDFGQRDKLYNGWKAAVERVKTQ